MNPRRPFRSKKLTRKQKAVVPCLYAAVIEAEARSVEECEEALKGGGR